MKRLAACGLALAIAACGDEATPVATPDPTTAVETPAPPGSAANAFIASLAIDPGDGTLFLGTGLGLFRVDPGRTEAERVIGELRTPGGSGPVSSNLVLRFAGPGELLASGHPEGAASALPENLGLMRSTDRAQTWEPVSELGEADFHILQVGSRGRVLGVRVEDENVELSADGGRAFSVGTPPAIPLDAVFNPDDPQQVAVTTEQGVYTSSDGGKTWRQRDVQSGEQLAWHAADLLYRADAGGAIRLSEDGGQTWTERGSVGLMVNELVTDQRGALYASVPGGEVKRSADGGQSWESVVVLK